MPQHAELAAALEPAQFAQARARRLPRRRLGWGVLALLWLLRVYVLVAIPLVVYAFIHALGGPAP